MTCSIVKRSLLLAPLLLALPAWADYASEVAKLKAAAPNDVTLHTLQTGLAAMAEGRLPEARNYLDGGLNVIEGMFADNVNAAKARSVWYAEGAKDFKGEPYERAMAFYYRGLAYLAEGDYENARAVFRSGILQDAFAEEQQYRSDFASLMMLEGWTNQLLGDMSQAKEAYAEAQRYLPGWQAPQEGANLLIIAELGGSPRKLGDGIHNEEIVYRRPKRTPESAVSVELDGVNYRPRQVEDVYFQASTRGGREIDRVIAGKLSLKATTDKIGRVSAEIANQGSLISAAGSGGGGRALGALAVVGAISSIISANVQPRADVRYWNNLPETLHAMTLSYKGLPASIKIELTDKDSNPVVADKLTVNKWIDPKGNVLIWIKSRN
jgi:tetratricopeptide (TPR) repeat protein